MGMCLCVRLVRVSRTVCAAPVHLDPDDRVVGVVLCTVLGQALGLLVPVGWALLLYTSGLSTQ